MLSKMFKTALAAVIAMILVSTAGCGQKADQNTRKVGPAGPTAPGGYYFTLEVHPAVVQVGGTVSLSVRVTDANGTAINGTVTTVTVHYSGSTTTGADDTIDASGYSSVYWTVTGTGGTVSYINANVEDKSLTIPIQVLP